MDAEALVRPVIEGAGLELVEVVSTRQDGRRLLRVTIDRPEGVDLDTIAELSERISRRLDLEGYAPGPYALEVSSPGIERALIRPEHFARAIGRNVKVKTTVEVDGSRSHSGILVESGDEAFVIDAAGGRMRLLYADLVSARTVADWAAELKGSSI
jgi:ribosome maturation factor RimP